MKCPQLIRCLLLAAFAVSMIAHAAFAQETVDVFEPPTDPFAPRLERAVKTLERRFETQDPYAFREGQFVIKLGNHESRDAIRQAAEVLRDAESDEDKGKSQADLRKLLNDYFKKDMERRKAELDEMEVRLTKLRDQLERRHEKMDEIVDLQIKVLINEAEGLGFFSSGGEPQHKTLIERGPLRDRYVAPTPTTIVAPTPATIEAAPPLAPAEPRPAPTRPASPRDRDESENRSEPQR